MQATRRRLVLGLMLVAFAFATAPGRVADGADRAPSTAPKDLPPARQVEDAKRLIARLTDDDYERREDARVALMGMRRADLPALREAVRQSLPLVPSQITVLREIVTHVYLTGDIYLPDPNGIGFLGVTLPGIDRDQRGVLGIGRGVAVLARSPGFGSYRLLQNGDVVLAVTADGERVEVNTTGELQDAVRSVKAGETVKLTVLRQGNTLTVAIRLDPCPFNINPLAFEEMNVRRNDQADEYWARDFAPLLEEKHFSIRPVPPESARLP